MRRMVLTYFSHDTEAKTENGTEAPLLPATGNIPQIKALPVALLNTDDGSLVYACQEGDTEVVSRLLQDIDPKSLNNTHGQVEGSVSL